jgi:hypothetical protein
MSLIRVLQTAQVVVEHTFIDGETPIDAAGAVTATLKRLDGTTVDTATAGHPGAPGLYTYTVPGQADVDMLTLDWQGSVGGAAVTVRDYIEIVGGHYFGLAAARVAHSGLGSTTIYPADLLAGRRIEVEQEFETICRQAFYPRFARHALSGQGTARLTIPQTLPHRMLRVVRAVTVGGVAWSAPDVAAVGVSESGVLYRPGGASWPAGHQNIVVEYEHGWDFPPERIVTAAVLRLRSLIATNSTGIPDRAISYATTEGGTYRLSTPSKQRTGIPDVDGVLERYTLAPRTVFA